MNMYILAVLVAGVAMVAALEPKERIASSNQPDDWSKELEKRGSEIKDVLLQAMPADIMSSVAKVERAFEERAVTPATFGLGSVLVFTLLRLAAVLNVIPLLGTLLSVIIIALTTALAPLLVGLLG